MQQTEIRQGTISEIKTTDVITVQETQALQDVVSNMVSNEISKIFVKNDDMPVGIISDKDIIRFLYIDRSGRGLDEVFASEIMNPICYAVDTMTCKQAAQMMMINKISSLGIGAKDRLEGIVTKSDLINYYSSAGSGDTKVIEYMTVSYFAAPHDSKIHEILKKMITCDISRVIVTMNGSPIGIITNGDIFRASLATNKMSIVQKHKDDVLWSETGFVGAQITSEIMTEGLLTVSSNSTMRTAAKLLMVEKIDSLGVNNGNSEMIGILNKSNVLHALADLT